MDIKDKQLLDAFSDIYSEQDTTLEFIINTESSLDGFGIQLSPTEAEAVRIAELEARCLMGYPEFVVSALIRNKDH